jgi:hypothetical protein
MNNIIELPTAKNYIHSYHKKLNLGEVLEFVYNNGLRTITDKQRKLLDKRIALEDEIIKALPPDKRKLFNRYMDLQLQDSILSIDKAIKWTIDHETEINEVMAG